MSDIVWTGERGAVNELLLGWQTSDSSWLQGAQKFLDAIEWYRGGAVHKGKNLRIGSAIAIIEPNFSEFGNPDLILVVTTKDEPDKRLVFFVEAKLGRYADSAMDPAEGMHRSGFNSSINGQLSLRYRFAQAWSVREKNSTSEVEEDQDIAAVYEKHHHDSGDPRRLVKDSVLAFLNRNLGKVNLTSSFYIALTGDTEMPSFANGCSEPCFRDGTSGVDQAALSRFGWLSFPKFLGQESWQTYASRSEELIQPQGLRLGSQGIYDPAHLRQLLAPYKLAKSIKEHTGSWDLLVGRKRRIKLVPLSGHRLLGDALVVALDTGNVWEATGNALADLEPFVISGRQFHGHVFSPWPADDDKQFALLLALAGITMK